MSAMELEHVEPGTGRALRRRNELSLDALHPGAVELGRRSADLVEIGNGRSRDERPVVALFAEWMIGIFPAELSGALPPGMAQLHADLCFRR